MTVKRNEEKHFVGSCDHPGCSETFGPLDVLRDYFRTKMACANWETSQNRKVHLCPSHRRSKPTNIIRS